MAPSRELKIDYSVEFRSGFHIGTGAGVAKILDGATYRKRHPDTRQLVPCIPGSSVKGVLKSRTEAMAGAFGIQFCDLETACLSERRCLSCRLYGSSLWPGTLRFSDLTPMQSWIDVTRGIEDSPIPSSLSRVRMGTGVDRATRTVEEDVLYSMEQSAEGIGLTGTIAGRWEPRMPGGCGDNIEAWFLVSSLLSLDRIGRSRMRGFGSCALFAWMRLALQASL